MPKWLDTNRVERERLTKDIQSGSAVKKLLRVKKSDLVNAVCYWLENVPVNSFRELEKQVKESKKQSFINQFREATYQARIKAFYKSDVSNSRKFVADITHAVKDDKLASLIAKSMSRAIERGGDDAAIAAYEAFQLCKAYIWHNAKMPHDGVAYGMGNILAFAETGTKQRMNSIKSADLTRKNISVETIMQKVESILKQHPETNTSKAKQKAAIELGMSYATLKNKLKAAKK